MYGVSLPRDNHLKRKDTHMNTRFVSMFVLAAALLLQPVFGDVGGVGQAQAQSKYVNFTFNGVIDIGVPPGKTDIYPECYSLTESAYWDATGTYFGFHCTSPVSDVTCHQGEPNDFHCECNNGSKKDHTVKVHMNGCSKPPEKK